MMQNNWHNPTHTNWGNCKERVKTYVGASYLKWQNTFGAKVAFESSCAYAFSLADPSKIEGSSRIKSSDPIEFKDIKNVYAVDQIYECKGAFSLK